VQDKISVSQFIAQLHLVQAYCSIISMSKRIYLSGSAKRKRNVRKQVQSESLSKLTTFFKPDLVTNVIDQIDPTVSGSQLSHEATTAILPLSSDSDTDTDSESNGSNLDEDQHTTQKVIAIDIVPAAPAQTTSAEIAPPPPDQTSSTDPGLWIINEELRAYWVARGPSDCQNKDVDFTQSGRIYPKKTGKLTKIRCLTKSCFKRELRNGQLVDREWLIYSPSQGRVYCFACRLFSNTDISFCTAGFNDWHHASVAISQHECSTEHNRCMSIYCARHQESGLIDSELKRQVKQEKLYWRQVLERLVAVVKYLATRGLAFRGQNEQIGSQFNGNYLGALELLSKFDPFLAEHMEKYGNRGKGNPSYLSANICDELIILMAQQLLTAIIQEVKAAKYYSISVDSTPDLSHCDQLTFTIRYVKNAEPVERFLQFIPIFGHGAENLCDVIIQFLQDNGISLLDCRGQAYDNASNMAGKYSGVQARIKQLNPLATFVPCAGHSLNLVGVKAVECCTQVVAFFDFIRKLYVFFSASTHRWTILATSIGPHCKVVKRLSDTRWSAHADAVHALCEGYTQIQVALDTLANDTNQTEDTILEARSLSSKMDKLEFVILILFWNHILVRYNEVSKTLQKKDVDLSVVISLLQSLQLFTAELRNDVEFVGFELKAKALAKEAEYADSVSSTRKRKRSIRLTRFEGAAPDTVLTGSSKFKVDTYLPVIDSLCQALLHRLSAYETIHGLFSFLLELPALDSSSIEDSCKSLALVYSVDIDEKEFVAECQHFKHHIHCQPKLQNQTKLSMSALYHVIKEDCLESTFPNLEIALRIYLTLMPTNCTGERSFSKLKIIKNHLRSTILQSRLTALSLMSIESELLEELDFSDIVQTFAATKSRRQCF
jgi:Domain of unknown function (DUF4371)/hAT family C-terminal dimerisation region